MSLFTILVTAAGALVDARAGFVKELSRQAEPMQKDAGGAELRIVETYVTADKAQALGQACVTAKAGKGRLDCHFSRGVLIRLSGPKDPAVDVLVPSFLGATRRLLRAAPAEPDFEAYCDGYKDRAVVDPGEAPFPALIALVEEHCAALTAASAAAFAKGAGELLKKSCFVAWTMQREVTLKPDGKKRMGIAGDGCDGAFVFEHDGNLKGVSVDERGAKGDCAELTEDNSPYAKGELWTSGFFKTEGCETLVFEASSKADVIDAKRERFSDAMRKLMEGDAAEAVEQLKQIPAMSAWRAKAVLGLAVARLALRQAPQADKDFAEAYRTIGEAPFGRSKDARIPVLLLRGQAAFDDGKTPAAHVDFERAAQLDGNHAPTVYWMARTAAKLRKFDEAAAGFKRAVELSAAWKRVFDLGSDADLDPTVHLDLRSAPPLEDVYSDAAVFLATTKEDKLRDGKLALGYAKLGIQASQGRGKAQLAALAAAMAETGDAEGAKKMLAKAIKGTKKADPERKLWKGWLEAVEKKAKIRQP